MEALRGEPGLAATPVIFMTAKSQPHEVARFKELGAVEVIAKPFDPMTLPSTVKSIWAQYHQERLANALIQEKLEALRHEYGQQLPDKAREIEKLWEQLPQSSWSAELFKTMHLLTHNLIGISATLGFNSLSRAARALEITLRPMIERGVTPTEEHQRQIEQAVVNLREASGDVLESIDTRVQQRDPSTIPHYVQDHRLIFVVGDAPEQDLAEQIGYFGYTVRTFVDMVELRQTVDATQPAAIIINHLSPGSSLTTTEAIAEIQRARETTIPVLFISSYGDMAMRLQAVRAGASAYLIRPIDIGTLIDKLDTLTAHQAPEPYRVLIVEDEPALAEHYALTLQQAGMHTTVVTDPLQVIAPMIDFRPDLILMDVYMPACTGIELARVIRQQEAYVSVPIVFLSVETDLDKQFAAMQLGGDDFLTKPIQPKHLISSVVGRAHRSRILRAFMVSDSLTGLFNHTKTKELLDIEIARAARVTPTPFFAFAMIDLDRFKSINDTYGHLTGDRVIKSLARLLQQRLRKTDIIGRYGGEEFAIILNNTDGPAAIKVLDEIRQGFAQIRHQAAGEEFSVTFSCGIATFPRYRDATRLNDAADKALYEAKRIGRNQVVLAWD
jgi:diguanylate cyclase (GGDEF)-like protein